MVSSLVTGLITEHCHMVGTEVTGLRTLIVALGKGYFTVEPGVKLRRGNRLCPVGFVTWIAIVVHERRAPYCRIRRGDQSRAPMFSKASKAKRLSRR